MTAVGFTAPTVSSTLAPMTGPMPNIITLPFGKSPPLHLQAPSWRHLLKLMARLSGTRIEPTLEAVAVSKEDLKLRTVVQFIRVRHPVPCHFFFIKTHLWSFRSTTHRQIGVWYYTSRLTIQWLQMPLMRGNTPMATSAPYLGHIPCQPYLHFFAMAQTLSYHRTTAFPLHPTHHTQHYPSTSRIWPCTSKPRWKTPEGRCMTVRVVFGSWQNASTATTQMIAT